MKETIQLWGYPMTMETQKKSLDVHWVNVTPKIQQPGVGNVQSHLAVGTATLRERLLCRLSKHQNCQLGQDLQND